MPRKATNAPAGRPRVHDRPVVLAAVCERIMAGELIEDAAKAEGVNAATIRKWVTADPSTLGTMYAQAREASADALEQKAILVAEMATNETVQQSRLMVDTYKWAAAKRHPKRYGDKLDVTSEGKGLAGLLAVAKSVDADA